jgi:hypothetical protein
VIVALDAHCLGRGSPASPWPMSGSYDQASMLSLKFDFVWQLRLFK